MDLDKFINDLGTPEEWSRVPGQIASEASTPERTVPDAETQKIIGSVSTKNEIDQILGSTQQD